MSNNGSKKVMIDCPSCGQRFGVTMPSVGVMNDLRASLGVATHEKPVRCICGQHFQFMAGRVYFDWGLVPITDEQVALLKGDNSRIVQPSDAEVRSIVH